MLKPTALETHVGEESRHEAPVKVSSQCNGSHFTGCLVRHQDGIVSCKTCGQVFEETEPDIFAPVEGAFRNRTQNKTRASMFS